MNESNIDQILTRSVVKPRNFQFKRNYIVGCITKRTLELTSETFSNNVRIEQN